jgi:hypothetical protein
MDTCKFCGANLPERAAFCGVCGQAMATPDDSVPFNQGENAGLSPFSNVTPGASRSDLLNASHLAPARAELIQDIDELSKKEEEEEERRRRAALLNLAFPLAAGEQSLGGAPMVYNTPTFANTPQVSGIPLADTATAQMPASLPDTPFGPSIDPGIGNGPAFSPVPHTPEPWGGDGWIEPGSTYNPTDAAPFPSSNHPPASQPAAPHGCLRIALILSIPLIILASIIGVELTLFAPSIALNGNTTVAPGGTLHIRGSRFLPNTTVTFTLDNTIPLNLITQADPGQRALKPLSANNTLLLTNQAALTLAAKNTVITSNNGTFDVTIKADPNWPTGQHSLRASENLSLRSATLYFNVTATGETLLPEETATVTGPPSTGTPSTPVTTGPLPTPIPGLASITPSSLALGPVGESSTQSSSGLVTINTRGTGTFSWTASWDAALAPWLRLSQTSGQIAAPGSQTITVSAASSTTLKAGNYGAAVVFTGSQGLVKLTLTVSFKVEAGCIQANPGGLLFTGTDLQNAAPQVVTLTNCGLTAPWSVTATSTGNWLKAVPLSGSLAKGAAAKVTVTASSVETKLAPGDYTGNLTFINGSTRKTVPVTLTVKATALLQVTPNTCTVTAGVLVSVCRVSVGSSSALGNVAWTASAPLGITVKPASGVVTAGKPVAVTITVGARACVGSPAVVFTGPTNTATVTIICSAPTPTPTTPPTTKPTPTSPPILF